MAVKTESGKDRPSYIPPSRQGKRKISAYLEPELFAALHEVTARSDVSMQDILERLCWDFVHKERASLPAPSVIEDAQRTRRALHMAHKALRNLEHAVNLICDPGAAQQLATLPDGASEPRECGSRGPKRPRKSAARADQITSHADPARG